MKEKKREVVLAMIIKERVYETCSKCGSRKLLHDEEYGCDVCKKKINISESESYLHFTVFHQSGQNENLQLCSWDCVFKKLSTVKSDYFVHIPFLYFDGTRPDRDDFFKAMKKFCSKNRKGK